MTIFIFLFLIISFGYSLFEKLKDKKGYTAFLAHHLKKERFASFFWWILVFINFITTLVLFYGVLSVLLNLHLLSVVFVFKITATAILVLLFGQRMAGDFQGAANLGIYMLLTIFGWYLQIQ